MKCDVVINGFMKGRKLETEIFKIKFHFECSCIRRKKFNFPAKQIVSHHPFIGFERNHAKAGVSKSQVRRKPALMTDNENNPKHRSKLRRDNFDRAGAN